MSKIPPFKVCRPAEIESSVCEGEKEFDQSDIVIVRQNFAVFNTPYFNVFRHTKLQTLSLLVCGLYKL
jgi:hypothetical protein